MYDCDSELLVEFLREMRDNDGSCYLHVSSDGGAQERDDKKKKRHLEFLVKTGRAEKENKIEFRITKDGDDFLNAIDKDKDT